MQIKMTPAERDYYVKCLGRMRCWIDGFEQAGKRGPHDADKLRQLQVLLESAT